MLSFYQQLPLTQLHDQKEAMQDGSVCPCCRRVAKWYYRYLQTDDSMQKYRCTLHPVTPIPGPAGWPAEDKVSQLY